MSSLYSIAFKGQVADGFSLTDVKASFAERFNKGSDVIDRLFSGNSVLLAKNIKHERAVAAIR